MRTLLVALLVLFSGCLSTTPHNPMRSHDKGDDEAPSSSLTVEPIPGGPVAEMKVLFLLQRDTAKTVLRMASELTPEQLEEFNAWLEQFGTEVVPDSPESPKSPDDNDSDRKVF